MTDVELQRLERCKKCSKSTEAEDFQGGTELYCPLHGYPCDMIIQCLYISDNKGNEQNFTFMRRNRMKNDMSDTLKYRARVYIDKAVIPQIEEDLKVMVYTLIGDKKLEITHSPEGFDTYPSCKDWQKDYCPCKRKKYQARLPEHALYWYGDSRTELYCKIITSIIGTKVYMPFSSIPRAHDEQED